MFSDFPAIDFQRSLAENSTWKYTNPSGAFIQNFRMTRSLEKGYPPSNERFEAFRKAREIIDTQNNISTLQNTWMERGPVNVGGRTRAIMFDPNVAGDKKVWAGGVSGGIWSIDDITSSSSSWQQADDFMANLAVSSLAFDPLNTTTFYAGTGEGWQNIDAVRGAGIFKSIDGGSTWTQLSSTSDFHYVQKVVVTAQGTILAAVKSLIFNASGIYRSTDQGTNWNKISNINGPGADIEIGQNGTILASIGIFSQGAIYRSTDDGVNWVNLTSIPPNAERIEIAIAPSDPDVVYAVSSNDTDAQWIIKSINGGSSWTELEIPETISQSCQPTTEDFAGGQAWYDLILGVHPTNPNLVIIGGIDLHRSLDGGTTWDQISYWTGGCLPFVHADQHAIIFRPGSPNEMLSGNDGGISYSTDITITNPLFSTRNNNYNITQFYSLALENSDQSNNMLGGTQDNGTHKFESSGLNSTSEVTGGDGGYCFIEQDLSVIQVTSYIGNQYFLSTNGGQSFDLLADDTDIGLFINPTGFDNHFDILYSAGNPGEIIRYSNLQMSPVIQTLEHTGMGQVTHIVPSERIPGRLFAGTDGGGIYRIENSHSENPIFFNITSDLSPLGYISSISIGENDDHLLVTFSNYDIPSVFESTDGGLSWIDKEGDLPNMPVRWALYDPVDMNKVILATEVGLWQTSDLSAGSPAWLPDNTGLANVRTDMLQIRKSDGLVGVATHGRGVFTADLVSQPIADFQIDNPIAYLQEPVGFRSTSFQPGGSTVWNFGDTGSSTLSIADHTYNTSGQFDVSLSVANGSDTKTVVGAVQVLPDLSTSYLSSDGGDFESNSDHFASFSLAGGTLTLGSSTQSGKNGTTSGSKAWVLEPNSNTYKPNTLAYLYTPNFNLSNPGTYSLSFMTKYDIESGYDGFFLEVSTDLGVEWTKLANNIGATWYNDVAASDARFFVPGEPIFSGNTSGSFVEKSVDISSFSQQENVAFRFVFLSDETVENAGLAIDDFVISAPTMAQFEVDKTSICDGESVIFSNLSSGTITSYSWDFGDGATPSSATGAGPHTVTYSTAGTKDVSLTINASTTESKTEFVTVNPLPSQIGADPLNSPICLGESAQITFSGLETDTDYLLVNADTQEEIQTFSSPISSSLIVSLDGLVADINLEIQGTNTITGCESVMTTTPSITVIPVPAPTITQNSQGTLTASLADSYQWHFEEAPIPGATMQSYDPDLKGSYSVEVEVNGCSGTSDIFDVVIVSINDDLNENVLIYPNPVTNYISIELNSGNERDCQLHLISTDGKIVVNRLMKIERSKMVLDLSDIPEGLYILRLNSGSFAIERMVYKKDNK